MVVLVTKGIFGYYFLLLLGAI